MPIKLLYKFIAIPTGPKELFKIHGVHFIILFIAHTVRLNLPVIDAHQGTGTDHIEPSIQLEELERGGTVRTGLQLIEEDKCFTRDKLKFRIKEGDVVLISNCKDNTFHIIPTIWKPIFHIFRTKKGAVSHIFRVIPLARNSMSSRYLS